MSIRSLSVVVACLSAFNSASAATFTVVNTNASGAGSLAQAITDANASAGSDTISFAITNLSLTIRPSAALPSITEPVTIDGRTQAGFVSAPIVEISGGSAGAAVDGLKIATSNSVISALVINGFLGDGIEITNGANNIVEGCYIGLNRTGATDSGNTLNGVLVTNSAANIIGGLGATNRNFISGNNQSGIAIGGASSASNSILGNIIGLNATNNAVANSVDGIRVNAPFTIIGNGTTAARNIISGNTGDGIESVAPLGTNMVVRGNWIGVDTNGVLDRGNTVNGILAAAGASIVGGSSAGEGNLITGNNDDGIELNGLSSTNHLVLGNVIGSTSAFAADVINGGNGILITTSSRSNVIGGIIAGEANTIYFNTGDGIGVAAANANTNNAFRGNLIFGNTASGIDLGAAGITANDNGDSDVGANLLQNFPVLTSVSNTATEVFISGTLNSRPSTAYAIDFFSSIEADTVLNGEGQFYIGSTNLATAADSNLAFTVSFPITLQGRHVSATATDPFGNTSEFSAAVGSVSFATAQTFTVVNTNDSGAGSLREAINQANLAATTGGDTIQFAITNLSMTISLSSELPALADTVTIDGYTQPGAAVNTSSTAFNGSVLVRLAGASAGSGANGITITASNCVVRGLIITGFVSTGADGVEISGGSNNLIEGCLIGIDGAGTDQGNGANGIFISGSPNNVIGGTTPAARNVISGNQSDGIEISGAGATGNQVLGNLIGTSLTGATAVANSADGVLVTVAGANIIGGSTTGAGNLISGNGNDGIELTGVSTTNTTVLGNRIGTDATGTAALANSVHGVNINTSSRSNVIGGVLVGAANTIAFNGQDGVNIAAATANTNNVIRGNSIFSNGTATGELGIDLGAAGVTANDAGDPDTGANQLQNFPVLTSVANSVTETVISGSLNSRPSASFTIDFYANVETDTDGFGEGRYHLGSTNLSTAADSNVTFTVSIPVASLPGRYITATATDEFGNTSEFGAHVVAVSTVPGTTYTVVNTNDSGAGSLRQAILNANANISAGDTIAFAITNLSTTISPSSALTTITDPVTIDGYTQPGAAVNTSATAFNGTALVRIAGASAGSGANGITITVGSSTVRGLMITGFTGTGADGIEISGAGGNTIEGCLIGIDSASTDQGNAANGVFISASPNNIIGGTTASARNVISGNNSDGIEISGAGATGNQVLGNLIGAGLNGVTDVGNTADGVLVTVAGANVIGGTNSGAGNLISGNGSDGVELTGLATTNTTVLGNRIGTDATGTAALANSVHGVNINTSSRSNVIGGVLAGAANMIAFNGQDGVNIAAATANTNNTIRGNSIFSNGTISGELGIDLGAAGVTANDAGDPDTGANQLQNFPVLAWVTNTITETIISGSLNSRPSTTYTIDFYASTDPDTDGVGEGQYYLGSTNLATAADSNIVFTISLPVVPLPGQFIAATATDPFGNTSEFGTNVYAQSTVAGTMFTVVNTNDSGAGSLRQAILDANANVSEGDTIAFAITNLANTISPSSALPTITDTVTIDGSTQPGFAGAPVVELNGAGAGSSVDGLKISASNCVVRALVINRFLSDGIEFSGGRDNTVEGCYIGLNLTGLTDQGNTAAGVFFSGSVSNLIGGLDVTNRNYISGNSGGISITSGDSPGNAILGNVIGLNVTNGVIANSALGISTSSAFTRIGGNSAGARNIISGNGDGMNILHPATNTIVQGNYIGTDSTGTLDRGNTDDGIVATAGGVIIGGSGAGEGNLISGNNAEGIELSGVNSTNATVRGNIIGADVSGTLALPNSSHGILITTSSRSNIIGGVSAGEANIIAFNAADGINIAAATANTNNTLRGNSIFSNGTTTAHLGIELGADGIAVNDAGDADTGANQLQNFPVLTGVTNSLTGTDVGGSLNSAANTTYILDFYSNPTPDTGGSGEGKTYLGSASVTTDGAGNTNFVVTIAATNLASRYVTATATDPFGNTSEFATNIFAFSTVPGLTLVVTNTNDSGPGSLREAILVANTNINAGDTITFNIPGVGVKIISPGSALPAVLDPVTINGFSQPGSSVNTLTNGHDGVILIQLDGALAGAGGVDGLQFTVMNCTVRGLSITRFSGDAVEFSGGSNGRVEGCHLGLAADGTTSQGNNGNGVNVTSTAAFVTIGGETVDARCVLGGNSRGITISSSKSNIVAGCRVGTDITGMSARANTNSGVLIAGTASAFNRVGGDTGAARCILSGNGTGFTSEGNGLTISGGVTNRVVGNYIGVDATGTNALGNQDDGLDIRTGASGNLIGGSGTGEGNVISGNFYGVNFESISPNQVGNIVRGNLIGPDATGTNALGNSYHGVMFGFAVLNQIGGSSPGEGNVISGNGANGVMVNCCAASSNSIVGNYIGVGADGVSSMGNWQDGIDAWADGTIIGGTAAGAGNIIANNVGFGVTVAIGAERCAILGNSIYGNGNLGIDLEVDGVTLNDVGDVDTGSNLGQNFPVLDRPLRTPTNTIISGSLSSRSNTTYRIEFFDNVVADVYGFGEAQTYLAFTNVTTSAAGIASFTYVHPSPLTNGHFITATATDPTNNTSELSLARQIVPFDSVNLIVTIEETDDPASWSTNHFYTIRATNDGPATATATFVTNTLPSGMNYVNATPSHGSASHSAGVVTWDIGNLPVGVDASLVLEVAVTNSGGYDVGSVVLSSEFDHDTNNNVFLDNTFFGFSDTAVGLMDSPDPAVAGQPLIFTLSVTNFGPDITTTASATVYVDGGAVYLGASASQGTFTFDPPNNAVTFLPGSLGVGGFATVTVTTVPTVSNTFFHFASVGSIEIDPDTGNNSTNETTSINDGPGVLMFSTSPYQVVENAGPVAVDVIRSGGGVGTVTVSYATSNLTALAAADYTTTTGTLTFTNGETVKSFTIPILDDASPECMEHFSISLFNVTGGAALVVNTNALVEIMDDQISPAGNVGVVSGINTNGPTGNDYSYDQDLSVDGSVIVFNSLATNFVAFDTNNAPDVFLYDVNAATFSLVSVSTNGIGTAENYSEDPRVSATGRYVTFTSYAIDLVTNQIAQGPNVYRRDMLSNVTELVSINASGTASGNNQSSSAILTPDGRFVVFASYADDLVTNDMNGNADIYIRDMQFSNRVELVSLNAVGNASGNSFGENPAVSADGRFVAYQTHSTDLGYTDLNGSYDVVVRDRLLGTNILCSRAMAGGVANLDSYDPIISANGRYVLFRSMASDIVPGDTNSVDDVFVYDLQTHTLELVSANTNGVPGNGYSYDASISADGRYVAFQSAASDLVPGDSNGAVSDVFVRDLLTDTTTVISVNCENGETADSYSFLPHITPDARYIVWQSSARNLVPGNFSGYDQIYRHDRLAATTALVSQNNSLSGGGVNNSSYALIATNGNTISFMSESSDLVPVDGNFATDVFMWRQGAVATTVDVVITKTASVGAEFEYVPFSYTLGVTNSGSAPATGVSASDVLPAGLSFVSANVSQGSVTNVGGIVTATIGSLATGDGAAVTITVFATNTGNILNTAFATAAESESSLLNNTNSALVTIDPLVPPMLTPIPTNSTQLLITWPVATPDVFLMQTATNLTPVVNWSDMTNSILSDGTVRFLLLNIDAGEPERYYRLKK